MLTIENNVHVKRAQIKMLVRRLQYLEQKIEGKNDAETNYDKAEINALRAAILVMEAVKYAYDQEMGKQNEEQHQEFYKQFGGNILVDEESETGDIISE